MSQQPEALELISLFELESDPESLYRRAATELRRLHAVESGAKVELMRRDNLIDSLHGLCESYRTQVESLQAEVNEQARLNGMAAERELALMAKVERLQAAGQVLDASEIYKRGWVACAGWAKRPDLIADIDSPAYANERAARLATPQPEPAWSPAYTRGPARQSAPVTAVPALVPLSVLQYNQIPELCQIRPSLYESVVRAIEAAIAKLNGLAVGDGAQPIKDTP